MWRLIPWALRMYEEAVWLPLHMGDSLPSVFFFFFSVIITDVIVILLIVTSVEEFYFGKLWIPEHCYSLL